MSRWQDISIKRKLTWIIMIASGTAVLLAAVGFVWCERQTRTQDFVEDLTSFAQVIANESTAVLEFSGLPDTDVTDARATQMLNALKSRSTIVAAALYKGSTVITNYFAPGVTNETIPALPSKGHYFEGDRHLVLWHDVPDKDGNRSAGSVYLKCDLRQLDARLKRYALAVIPVLLICVAVTYLLSALLQRIISKPISHLAATARQVSEEKNYAIRAVKHGTDELGQLIDGFNAMLEKIHTWNDELESKVHARTRDLVAEIKDRERAESALQQQFYRISLLNRITQAISERQDTQSILHVVLRQLEDHLNLDFGAVALFEPKAGTLNTAAVRIKNPLLAPKLELREGGVLTLDESGLELCKDGQTVYVRDTMKGSSLLCERLAGAGIRSAVAVPMSVDGKLFGVLLSARLQAEAFSSADAEFLRMLSEHVALAAHQALLHAELEQAYNDLRKSQQTIMQQERLKALGQMASGIAHDVNNALSPVVGFADLLMANEKGMSSAGKRHLQHIRTAGEDIAHIVARLREFYRRRDEHESLAEVEVNKLAEQVVDMTRPRWRDIPQSHGITVEVKTELGPNIPALVGIESEVREAITNLVLNAVDALPNGGAITLRTRMTRGDVHPINSPYQTHVVIEVIDTGTGMSDETRKRCLEPFFSTKGKRGTGLGLAMVYGVMQRHEGVIEIDTELGKGTTFRLVFPVRKLQVGDANVSQVAPSAEPLRILCIDDEPLLRDLLKEMLERDGHTVETRDNGQTGLEAFREAHKDGKPFDVIITDLGMPYVDGRQVTRIVKSEFPGTPVVMLTGWGAFMKEDDSGPSQVDALLSKPPRSKEIRDTLSRLRPACAPGRR